MSDNVTVAIVSSCSTFLTALASLILVYRGFNSIELRLELLEADLKQFFKTLTGNERDIEQHDKRITKLEEKP